MGNSEEGKPRGMRVVLATRVHSNNSTPADGSLQMRNADIPLGEFIAHGRRSSHSFTLELHHLTTPLQRCTHMLVRDTRDPPWIPHSPAGLSRSGHAEAAAACYAASQTLDCPRQVMVAHLAVASASEEGYSQPFLQPHPRNGRRRWSRP